MPDNIIAPIKLIYARLSTRALLRKWENPKPERIPKLHDMEYRLPKSTFVGETVLELGIYDAVAHFNMGSGFAKNILLEDGLDPGSYFEQGIWRADKKRIKNADHRATPEAKKRRKVLRGQKKKKEDQNKEAEGKTYETGAF